MSEDALRNRVERLLGLRVSGRRQSPARLRRAANQSAKAGCVPYIREHEPELTPETVARALADHDIPEDVLNYDDYNSEEGRERLSRVATFGMWRLLTTDAGKDLMLDRDHLESAWMRREKLREELDLVRARVDEVVGRARRQRSSSPSRMRPASAAMR